MGCSSKIKGIGYVSGISIMSIFHHSPAVAVTTTLALRDFHASTKGAKPAPAHDATSLRPYSSFHVSSRSFRQIGCRSSRLNTIVNSVLDGSRGVGRAQGNYYLQVRNRTMARSTATMPLMMDIITPAMALMTVMMQSPMP